MTYTSILHCNQKSTFCPCKNRHETSHDPHHPDRVFTCSKLINIQASRMVRNFVLFNAVPLLPQNNAIILWRIDNLYQVALEYDTCFKDIQL